jgi:hypothetical protein
MTAYEKEILIFRNDEETDESAAHKDLSNYDFSGVQLVQFDV